MRPWPLALLLATACKDGDGADPGETPPDGVEAIAPVGDDPDPGRLARIRSHPIDVAVRDQLPPLEDSFTYGYRAADGTLWLLDAGYTHEAGRIGSSLQAVENIDALNALADMLDWLEPGAGLADVDGVLLDNGQLDHLMQVMWVTAADETSALDVWIGEADAKLVLGDPADCRRADLPEVIDALHPDLSGPAFDVQRVTGPTLITPGLELYPAPSVTPGTLFVDLPTHGHVVGSNPLDPDGTGWDGDASPCKVDRATHDASRASIPGDRVFLSVHP